MRPSGDDDGMADLLDPDARPLISNDSGGYDYGEDQFNRKKVVQKVDMFTENKWVKINLCEDADGDFFVSKENDEESDRRQGTGMFRKRGG
jgi:hypothetical protein